MTMQERRSGKAFLIDFGVEESVFPASAADKRQQAISSPLVAANIKLIKIWGKRNISLLFGKTHTFTQVFHVVNVT